MAARSVIFFVYAQDEKLKNQLEKQQGLLKWQCLIINWHDCGTSAGMAWANEIDSHLNRASIIFLLVSPYFMAHSYCYGIEMKRAMERHKTSEAHVIPASLLEEKVI